jgi:hypothetical protein
MIAWRLIVPTAFGNLADSGCLQIFRESVPVDRERVAYGSPIRKKRLIPDSALPGLGTLTKKIKNCQHATHSSTQQF